MAKWINITEVASKGGNARAKELSAKRRREIARLGGLKRAENARKKK